MDYESIINNLKQNIEKFQDYEDKTSTSKVINRFLKDLAIYHNHDYTEINGSYYIKKGVYPKAILHLNIDSSFSNKAFNFIFNENQIEAGKSINIFTAILVIGQLIDQSTNDFDVLITNNNIQSDLKNYEYLTDILRSDKIINLNLTKAWCIADEFSSLILSNVKVPVERYEPNFEYKTYRITLDNLIGGHTGEDLDKLRLNSIKTLMALIRRIKSKVDLDIFRFVGGDRYDFIPSCAYTDFIIKSEYQSDLFNFFNLLKNEFIEKNLKFEPDMLLELNEIEDSSLLPINELSFSHLSSFVELLPTGAYAVNSLNNQLISSLNLSTARTFDSFINFIIVYRSLTEESMKEMQDKTLTAASISSSLVTNGFSIPKWMNKDETLTNVFKKVYQDLTQQELPVIKTQYSLDSSMIFSKLNVSIISLGVEYKQREDNTCYSNLSDIATVANLIDNVLASI